MHSSFPLADLRCRRRVTAMDALMTHRAEGNQVRLGIDTAATPKLRMVNLQIRFA